MNDRILTIAGVVLAVVPWLFPGIATPWKLVATLGATTAVGSALAIYYGFLYYRKTQGLPDRNPSRFAELPNMNEAYRELLHERVPKIRTLSYSGNFTWRSLLDAASGAVDDVELQLLIRDPNVPWQHPPSASDQHNRRMDDIRTVLKDLTERSEFQQMKHQLQKLNRSSFLRFMPSEP